LKIHLKFGSIFQEIFGGREGEIDLLEGADIARLLDVLCSTPERRAKIFDPTGKNLRPYVTISKNGRFIIHLDWLQTRLSDGDRVEFFLLGAGG
jgi:molybdopterin converting factor small subunit